MTNRSIAGLCAVLSLSACTVGPNFKPPSPPDAMSFKRAQPGDAAIAQSSDPDPQWWAGFNDPVLSQLIDKAIAGNLDLQQAILRVVEARQGVAQAQAAGLPTLGGSASYQRSQLGLKGILESKGVDKNLNDLADKYQPLDSIAPGLSQQIGTADRKILDQVGEPNNLFQYGLDASWELDLFGRVRRSVEQARAQAEATGESANDALVLLESEVAQNYMQLRTAQLLADSQRQNIADAQDAFELTARRQRAGLTTQLDVEQARTQLDDTKRQMPAYEKQVEQAMNALSVLTGQAPGAIDTLLAAKRPLPTIPAVVETGLPSSLARRRPDVRQAEAQLHAATAGVGVAVASFYPDVSLTGNLGIRATDASFLTKWASNFYSFGPSISLPIFQGGKLTSNLRLAKARNEEAVLHYRGTVLNALREVEDALVAYRTDRAARNQLADTVRSAQLTADLSRNQYAHGLRDFIQVTDADRTLTSARQQLVQADAQVVNDVVALYRALGGGWQLPAGARPVERADKAAAATIKAPNDGAAFDRP